MIKPNILTDQLGVPMIRLTSTAVAAAWVATAGILAAVAPMALVTAQHNGQGESTPSLASLTSGQQLHARDQLVAPDGLHTLIMQPDGNLVQRAGGVAVWGTHTEGHRGAYLVLQTDGNLVLRQGRTPLWASGTASTQAVNRVALSIQDDGNLVLYRSIGTGKPAAVWQSHTPDTALKQIRVRTGCQATLTASSPVVNAPQGLVTSLVPIGTSPDAALVCRYASNVTPGGSAATLLRATTLNRAAATRLSTALGHVTLGYPGGMVPCPSGDGSKTIIALHYPRRTADVDIAYSTSGCRLLDNGYVVAGQFENPSFDEFQTVLGQLTPGSN